VIAGVSRLTTFAATSDASRARLASINAGGTVAAKAFSNALAAALAWLAIAPACSAVFVNQRM
jgi:hypothetical protein